MELRPYQEDLIEEVRGRLRSGAKSVLLQAPTGSGKTVLISSMIRNAHRRGKRMWLMVHRKELVEQTSRMFYQWDIPHGIICAGYDFNPRQAVQICSVPTISRRLDHYPKQLLPHAVAWDECHHTGAKTWQDTYERLGESAHHIGLTATPWRLDGKGLRPWFETMVTGPKVSWLIENGYLSDYKVYGARVDIENVKTIAGDFARGDLGVAMAKPSVVGDAVKHYKQLCGGKKAILFSPTRGHSQMMCQAFYEAGVPAAHIDGETSPEVRKLLISKYRKGELLVLCNVDLFGEGFDVPDTEASILMRPTQSLSLYLQQVGRALRPHEGKKHAIILDHAGNVSRHGLPDQDRVWTLDGDPSKARKKDREALAAIRVCPNCFAANPPAIKECRFCSAEMPVKEREINFVDGELVEIDKERARKQARQEQGQATSMQDLINLGRKRGYKNPAGWAHYVYHSRKRNK